MRTLLLAGEPEDALVVSEEHRDWCRANGKLALEMSHRYLSALCYMDLKLYKRAVQLFRQVINSSKGLANIYATAELSRCYERLNLGSEAKKR